MPKTYRAKVAPKPVPTNRLITQTSRFLKTQRFARLYVWASLAILFATTSLWAVLGARLEQSNADQLVDPLLFRHAHTLHQATLPGAHSYLLKWPLFWLIGTVGTSANTFILFTVGIVLATVASLAIILYWIDSRPLIFGTMCLALASTLLLIPAQPYAGGLLPVNMAMITTRNLEYIVYIVSLVLLVWAPRVKSSRFWLAVGGLTLLIASDKLFMSLSLGGALLALLVYVFVKRWDLATLAMNWLTASVLASVLATLLLWFVNASGLVHIAGQAGAGPYGFITSTKDLGVGLIYAVAGLFTNFGANPAVDANVVKRLPHQALSRLASVAGPAYTMNGLLFLGGLYIVYRLVAPSLRQLPTKPKQHARLDVPTRLSLLLTWTLVAALGVFVVSNHYYAVDARYLTIALFAVFITAATFVRGKQLPAANVVLAGCVITVGILLGLTSVFKSYHDGRRALSSTNNRNTIVTQVLSHHPVNTLLGDYWRVIPATVASGDKLNVTPLADCSKPRDTLSSGAWQPDINNHSFAYLLSFDGSLTDYPNCSLKQVIAAYGRPNASTLIAGSYDNPKEQLLFYDHGKNNSAPATKQLSQVPSTVVPVAPDELPYLSCSNPTIMNFVAHQDDDLLFMNPDLLHDIKAGYCIRTVYLTAGDSGQGELYWFNRERGSEAAYASMLGLKNPIWVQRIVKLANNEFITVANPRNNSKISLIFMYLPDGGLQGQGFRISSYQSLAKLRAGQIRTLQSVDAQSSYSSDELVSALATLLHTYQPTRINTQAGYISKVYPDHSDHIAVGQFVKQAYGEYEKDQYDNQVQIPITFYIGYPVHAMAQNVSDGDLAAKEAAFFAYAQFDVGVCNTLAQCSQTPTYSAYLTRQYQNPY